jgi:peptidyl-prolyl cis-trans isomerase SurA
MIGRSVLPLFLLLVLGAGGVEARQATPPELVDRVVAVVGDSVVLLSQVEEETQRLTLRGIAVPTEPQALASLRSDLLNAMVNQLLIIQEAVRDSTLTVDDAELEQIAADQISQQVRRAGTQAALTQQLAQQGFSLTAYREFIKSEVRRERLQQMYLQKAQAMGSNVMVDEEEVRAAWEEQRAQIPPLPASVSAYQVVVEPQPSDSARAAAREEAQRLLDQIRAGEDFETLARRFSQDPGSAQQGGDLGWFRRGVMVREFEDTAFRLPENQVSEVVETTFGAHVIKVERVRGGERKGRHILIRADVTEGDIQRARERAAELRRRVDGGESLLGLRGEFGMEGPGALPDSIFTPVDQINELPEGYRPMATSQPGEILGPIEFEFQGSTYFAVVQVDEVREAGPRTFDDVKDQLRARIQEQKVLERIIERLRERSYVELRM